MMSGIGKSRTMAVQSSEESVASLLDEYSYNNKRAAATCTGDESSNVGQELVVVCYCDNTAVVAILKSG